jgi:hypothetical protein
MVALWDRCRTVVPVGATRVVVAEGEAAALLAAGEPPLCQLSPAAVHPDRWAEQPLPQPGVASHLLVQWPAAGVAALDPIDLFEFALRLLPMGGELWLGGEFAVERDQLLPDPRPWLEHVLRLAERFGCTAEVVAEDDSQHLLRCIRSEAKNWQLGRITPGRAGEMQALFAEVFGHPMSAAHWQWKYGDGRGLGIGVWRCGDAAPDRLVAHYGGTSRSIRYAGQPSRAFQACDLMVAVSDRGALTRKGPVFLAGSTYLEHELGYGAPHLLGIGFPNERAYRLPEKLGLYADVLARIQEVSWPARLARSWRATVREIDLADPAAAALIDTAWTAMCRSLPQHIVGVRDAAYVRQRYQAHPEFAYRVFVVRRRLLGSVLGVLVLRRLDGEDGPVCELLDAIGPVGRMPELVGHARRLAAALGAGRLFAWLADNLLPYFPLAGEAVVRDLQVLVPGNNWTPGPSTASLQGRWWLTGGDTDFH